ncbi:centrosomal protein of 164 kDa-like isoform X1 [Salvelinus alpinus]|uniref:centrosomal protein of 164 kDa-like isoform X1 n=2 Tax=Salvelinus alpinus TaxID=8036 RepID=UPI0039FD1FD6
MNMCLCRNTKLVEQVMAIEIFHSNSMVILILILRSYCSDDIIMNFNKPVYDVNQNSLTRTGRFQEGPATFHHIMMQEQGDQQLCKAQEAQRVERAVLLEAVQGLEIELSVCQQRQKDLQDTFSTAQSHWRAQEERLHHEVFSLTCLLGDHRQMTDSLIETVKTEQKKAANQFAERSTENPGKQDEMVADAAEGKGYNQSRPRLQRTMKLHSDLHQALEGLQLQTLASPSPSLDPMSSYQVSVQQLQEELQREKDQVSRLVERLERAEQKSEELRQQQEQDAKESWNTVHQEMETNQEMGGMVERMRGKVQEVSAILRRKISWGGWAGMKDEEEEEEEGKPANALNSECVNQCQTMHPDPQMLEQAQRNPELEPEKGAQDQHSCLETLLWRWQKTLGGQRDIVKRLKADMKRETESMQVMAAGLLNNRQHSLDTCQVQALEEHLEIWRRRQREMKMQLSEMQTQFDMERNRSAEFLKENDKLSRLLCTVESSVADLQPLLTYHQVLVEDAMKDNSIQHGRHWSKM